MGIQELQFTDREAVLYDAIDARYNPDIPPSDAEYYGRYLPSLHTVDNAADLLADITWYQGERFDWAPESLTDHIKRGMKAGFLWAKAELAHA